LNLFIDVLCAAVHSWLLTAGLLWCWRLTRPALCCIVQMYTDVVRQRGGTCW